MLNKIRTFATPLIAVLVLVLMILWLAGAFESKIAPDEIKPARQNTGETIMLATTRLPVYENVPATVRSKQSSDVAARILATISAIHVKAGDSVKQGDLLIELDNRDLQANASQARENVNAIKARLLQAKAQFNRAKSLYSKESMTKADMESAAAAYDSLKAQLGSARQQLQAAVTALSYSRIKAAYPARVIDRFAEPGDMASPGMKLLTLYDPQALRIEAHIRESLALNLQIGQSLQTHVAAVDKNILATIEEIVPAADPGARSFLIKAKIEQQSQLMPGMFARIRIPAGETDQLLIPESAIVQFGQLDVVWVLEKDIPVRRFIRLGKRYKDGQVAVISGLSDGEKLLVKDQQRGL